MRQPPRQPQVRTLGGWALVVVLCLLLAASPAAGVPSLDAITLETGDTMLLSTSFDHKTPNGTNRLLLVSASWDDANDVNLTSVTYAGEELTCLDEAKNASEVGSQMCYLVAPPTGTNTLDVAWVSEVAEWAIVARSLTDVDQQQPLGATTLASGNSTQASDTIETTEPDSVVVSHVGTVDADVSLDPISDTLEDVEGSAGLSSLGISAAAGRVNTTTAGTYETGWNLSSEQAWALETAEVRRDPEKVSFNETSTSGDESTSPVSIDVVMNRSSSGAVTVDYKVADGNASSDDHNISAGTLTVEAGQTSATLSLDITDDASDEPDEWVLLELESAQGAAVVSPKTFNYTILDDDPNHAPDPSDVSISTDEDTNVSDTASASDIDQNDTIDSFAVDTGPSHGSLSLNSSTGDFTYSPDADYNGEDAFTFTATDNHGATSANATVNITVDAVNDAPVAEADAATTDEDSKVWVDVLGNDSDVEGDALSIASVTTPDNGSTSLPGNGTVEYTPDADYDGDDAFSYNVSDGSLTDTTTVDITVNAVDDAPVAGDDSASTPVNQTVWIDVLGNDVDVDGDNLSVASASSPSHGTTSLPGNGTVEYTPDPGYEGSDSFTYNVSDGSITDEGTVDVTVGSATGILASDVRAIEGSLDADPALRTTIIGSSMFLQLENSTGGIELAGMGADTDTTLEINLTVKDFTATALMGRARVQDWSTTSNPDGTENISLELRPISMAFIHDCEQYSEFMGYCGPSSVDEWPTNASEDQADVAFDAGLRVFLSDLSYLDSEERDELEGAFMTTDAQALGPMNVSGTDSPDGPSLEMTVAGPHTLPDGSTNEGFFEARLPDALLSSWGVQDPSTLAGTYEGENRTVDVSDVSEGTLVTMKIHYSSGKVSVGEDTTDPVAEAGDDATVTEGTSITFDGTNSSDNQRIETYTWDLGDGTNATGATPSHTYEDPGTYEVTLNVSDAAGNTDTDNLTVTVEAQSTGDGDLSADAASGDESESEGERTQNTTMTEGSNSSALISNPRTLAGVDDAEDPSTNSSSEATLLDHDPISLTVLGLAAVALLCGLGVFAVRRMR